MANPVPGSSDANACRDCLPGSFSAAAGQGTCEQCPAGTFTPEYGSTACQGCTGGSYCIEGAATPVYCASGTIGDGTNLTSQANCSASKPGYWSTAGQSVACLTGFYQPDRGATSQTACKPCPTNSTTIGEASTSISDCVCKAEFVYVRLNETDPDDPNVNSTDADMIDMLKTGGYCSRCKAGSTCPLVGTTVDDLPVKHGYCNMSRVSNVGPIRYRAR